MALTPGTTLGPYTVTAKIGEGGMGVRLRQGFGGFPFALATAGITDE